MKPLATNQQVLLWLGLYPFDEETSNSRKIRSIGVGSLYFGIGLSACVSCEIFFMKHVTTNLEDSLYALGQSLVYWNILYLTTFAFVQRYKIAAIIENLAKIYEKCKNQCSFFKSEMENLIILNMVNWFFN